MSTRKQSPEMMKVLAHPSRVALYELIRDGVNTAPQMAEVLGENRLNLYHHLSKLEQVNLIKSSYGPDRVKIYDLVTETLETQTEAIEHQAFEETDMTHSFVLTAPKDLSKGRKNKRVKFSAIVRDLANLVNVELPDNLEVLQVQIIAQSKSAIAKRNQVMQDILDQKNQQSK